jgi:hypothetical protein
MEKGNASLRQVSYSSAWATAGVKLMANINTSGDIARNIVFTD